MILCLRNPLEVAISLHRRNNSSIPFGINLWEIYNRQLVYNVLPEQLILTHYDSFFYDAKSELKRILDFLGHGVSQDKINQAISTVSLSMRHTDYKIQSLKKSGASIKCLKLYDDLCKRAFPAYGNVKPNEYRNLTQKTYSHELTSIIILTHNQLKYTKTCIESIFKYTNHPFELILVDNGSNEDTKKYLDLIHHIYETDSNRVSLKKKKQKTKRKDNKVLLFNKNCEGLKVIFNRRNKGFAAGNNQGLAVARGKYLLLLNNDVVVTPGWLERLIACAENHPNAGIIGPRSNYVSGPQLVTEIGYNTENLKGLETFAEQYAVKNRQKASRILRVVGFGAEHAKPNHP